MLGGEPPPNETRQQETVEGAPAITEFRFPNR